ncbi:MAG: hypothetical protein HUJ68_04965 [Clostridia bacterium]|nr:hypothetical protein [Clostridia bacterium]
MTKSASGSAKEARDRRTQSILSLKGKIINTLKVDFSKAIANDEVRNMILAFGLTIDKDKITVDKSKLRYSKIVCMTDADIDNFVVLA